MDVWLVSIKTVLVHFKRQNLRKICTILISIVASFVISVKVDAATFSLGPASGTVTVGSTFDVSVLLDTQGETVNALEFSLQFPPDKLQLVSPSTGKSVVTLWTAQPRFNNQTGTVDLQGGMPGGINVSSGLITTLVFRVKAPGSAVLRFSLTKSKVLLHDGLGTDVLRQAQSGVYELTLPAPQGPIVASETHPQHSKWYANATAVLRWAPESDVAGYSYVLNEEPVEFLDDISEGSKNVVAYKNLSDGTHYFHIKALRNGIWGGTTHFALNVDTSPPAEFGIEIIPGARTTRRQPVISFATTDQYSGVDHYKLKLVPLKPVPGQEPDGEQPLFIDAESPYVSAPLEVGPYDVIVRAYDKAGNYREVTQRLRIVNALFRFISDRGLEIKSVFVISWIWFFLIVGLLLAGLAYAARRVRRWHRRVAHHGSGKEPPSYLKEKLEELKKYREKYGKMLLLLLCIGAVIFGGSPALAQEVALAPPIVTIVSRDISNEEIFYIGGASEAANGQVIIYFQNLRTGETTSRAVVVDKQGEWFYRHDAFLSSGDYLLWAQGKAGDLMSPPGPQILMQVRSTAIQFGASRLSYEVLYLILVVLLALALAGLIGYTAYHGYHGRKKHRRFMKEVKEAEEAVRRGFAILRKDIQAELDVVKKMKLGRELAAEEKAKEEQLLKDLDWVERYVGKEVWDVEKAGP